MKLSTIIGILLIALGAIALVYPRISYTKREKVLDIGPLQATAETKESIPLSPIVAAVAIVGGIGLIIAGNKRNV
jgi:hypothetical protein